MKNVKRLQATARRQTRAELTRRHIVESATPLFVSNGYEATSMRQLADAAGVSVQTLYNAFDSKFGLFSALMDVIVAGDHRPLALADRPDVQALVTIADPTALVRAAASTATPILERLDVIYPTLRAAAVSDPQVAAAYRRFVVDARYDHFRTLGSRLSDLGALPTSIDASRAADILWTVLSPDTYHLLAGQRRWTAAEFEAWATATLLATLIGKSHRRRRSRRE